MSRAKAQKKHVAEIEAGTNAFLREVDEAMHLDKLHGVWKKYKITLFSLLVLIFATVAGRDFYLDNKEATLVNQAEIYRQIIQNEVQGEEKPAMLNELISTGSGGYKLLAEFKMAQDLNAKGDVQAAAEIYKKIASDTNVGKAYRDLAKFHQAQVLMTADSETANSIFAALESEGSAFRGSALEMMAIIAENKADYANALALYEKMLEIQSITQDMQQRATARIAIIKRDFQQ